MKDCCPSFTDDSLHPFKINPDKLERCEGYLDEKRQRVQGESKSGSKAVRAASEGFEGDLQESEQEQALQAEPT